MAYLLSEIVPSFSFPFSLTKNGKEKKIPLSFLHQIKDIQQSILKKASSFNFPILIFQEEEVSYQNNFLIDFFMREITSKIQQLRDYQDTKEDWKILSNEIESFLNFQ